MISSRFENDGISLIDLSHTQITFKNQLEKKILSGIYSFEDILCVICNCKTFETLSKKDRYGLFMSVVICKTCGLVQTNPRMKQNNYFEFYKHEYRKIYNEEENPSEKFFKGQFNHGKLIYDFIKSSVNYELKNKLVVEIGTGSGSIP